MKNKVHPVTRFTKLLINKRKSDLTQELYELLYIHSNQFIAHFNRDGFFKARIEDSEGFEKTVRLLSIAKYKSETSEENKMVNKIIDVAKCYSENPKAFVVVEE